MNRKNILSEIIHENDKMDFRELLSKLSQERGRFLLRNDVVLMFQAYCDENLRDPFFREESSLAKFINKIQELFFSENNLAVMYRTRISDYRFFLIRADGEYCDEIDIGAYLDLKDHFIRGKRPDSKHLEIDFTSFYDFSPSIKDPKTIGNGIRFLNRYMSSNIFNKPDEWNEKLFQFIKLHKYDNQQLLVNESLIKNFEAFYAELNRTVEWLKNLPSETPFSEIEEKLGRSGFEPGWGRNTEAIIRRMSLLLELINEPSLGKLEEFLSIVPMPLISKIAVISPHGWFAQENVLGRPDTGGQVIYILDQVRALERHLARVIGETGLKVHPKILVVTRYIPNAEDTTCDVRMEKIYNTENCWILRIPFKDRNGRVIDHWISRFHIWPYLEQFAFDASTQLMSEFQSRPDLVIGNYSDGNLVATLISDQLDVIQCSIAHALEKTKYLYSDLYWQDNENDYHFSIQFMADMLAMNKSDFIISSTHQEIIGTDDSMGQYESYQFFTMPDLCQVKCGVHLFTPKFNVIPPGVDEQIYFPYYKREHRVRDRTAYWEKRFFLESSENTFGTLANPEKMPIFTMARFDRIKNITGLIEAFGMSTLLQENCNLIFAAGTTNPDLSTDAEEKNEILRAYSLIDHYSLHDQIRWLPSIPKLETGEAYRVIADHGGIFVQPALFEAFGLTILEAMSSGLPTFGPVFGGPQEIIVPEESGYLLNTSSPELIAKGLEKRLQEMQKNRGLWKKISEGGIERVQEEFTWKLYSEKLISLAKLYGFWRFSVSGKGKIKMDRYCDLIYHFLIKKRAEQLSI